MKKSWVKVKEKICHISITMVDEYSGSSIGIIKSGVFTESEVKNSEYLSLIKDIDLPLDFGWSFHYDWKEVVKVKEL